MGVYLSDEEALASVHALAEAGGNKAEAARQLNIARSTLESRIIIAQRRNLTGLAFGGPTPDGFSIKGVSTLYNREGDVTAQWVKTARDSEMLNLAIAAIQDAFEEYRGFSKPVVAPRDNEEALLTAYMIADLHLGLYSWARETGEDYDVAIASGLLKDAMSRLSASASPSAVGVVLNLGDFFHADGDDARTPRSGNPLDVDSRYDKVLLTGARLMIHAIELAKAKHKLVLVRNLPGNHDPRGSKALGLALAMFYDNDPRVEVDIEPSPFWVHQWGANMLAAHHGDTIKPKDFPGFMAANWPTVWGATRWRYAFFGHIHHASVGGGEAHGVRWETFQTLAAKDAWHKAMGYSSGRSMTAITFHKEDGEIMRHTVNVK